MTSSLTESGKRKFPFSNLRIDKRLMERDQANKADALSVEKQNR